MAISPNKFVWYELMTTDATAAAAFYRDVVGWSVEKSPMADMDYTLFKTGTVQIAGAFTLSKEEVSHGAPVAWIGYIGTDDIDRSATELRAAGGKIWRGPNEIPGVGRFATVSDPQGAAFALFQPARSDDASPVNAAGRGHVGWHELYAGDGVSAFDFYAKLYHWQKGDVMDMGPAGPYQMFSAGGDAIGGMMTKPAQMANPAWGFYFNVAGIDAAAARVKAGGGQIAHGPDEVPGGQWVLRGIDPQGGHFALVGSK